MKLLTLFASILFASAAHADSVDTIPFRGALAATNEPSGAADPSATGSVTILLHIVRNSAGAITSGSFEVSANYQFAGAVSLTGMHIHKGPAGVNGPIVVPFPLTRIDDSTGSGQISARQVNFANTDASTTVLDAVNGILADPGAFYFNVHSTDSPGGAIRAQLQRAEQVVLMGIMSPSNEVPAIQGSSAQGIATVVAYRTLVGNTINSAHVIFDMNYSGFSSGTNFTGFHIHLGGPTVNGPVTINSGLAGPLAAAVSGAGNLHYEVDVDLTRAGALDTVYALFQNPAATYINVHTQASPGGAARAQLHRTDHSVFQVTATPDQEAPAVTGLAASAPAAIHVYALRNPDGTIPAGAVLFDVNPRYPSGTTFTAMHLHDGPAGVSGPVTIDGKLSSAPILATDGTGNLTRLSTVSSSAALASLNDLVLSPEKHYYNLHTSANPGGATRAQLGSANPPAPQVTAAISAVSDITRTIAAPNSLMSVYGANLAAASATLDGFLDLSAPVTSINGTSVTVAGKNTSMIAVAPDHVEILVPLGTAPGNQPLVLKNTNGTSNTFLLPVEPVAPNIFFDSVGGIVAKNATFSLVRPDNPAVAGDILVAFMTGLNPPCVGNLPTGFCTAINPQTAVLVGGVSAQVLYALPSPGFPGLYQVAFVLPAGIPSGSTTLQISQFNTPSNTVSLAVQ